MLLAKLREGYDLVSGWRHQRQDAALQRKLPSKIANRLIGRVTGVRLHDYGCSLKAYSRDVLADMRLYGELHRFLPALAFIEGARITEVKVNHRARQFGSSKYGIDRTFRVLMDLLTVWFMKRFLTRPMYVFGFGGLIAILLSLVASTYLLGREGDGRRHRQSPSLLTLAVVLGLAGIQLFCFGLLGELLIRTYHESQDRPIYRIRATLRGGRGGLSGPPAWSRTTEAAAIASAPPRPPRGHRCHADAWRRRARHERCPHCWACLTTPPADRCRAQRPCSLAKRLLRANRSR